MAEEKGEYSVYYWTACKQFWGRAIGIVLTLDHAKAKFSVSEPDQKPEGVGFAVPVITLPSGQSLSQTPAILDVLGEALGLGGSTKEEQIDCKQCVLDLNDIFSESATGKWSGNPDRADKWLSLLEARLKKHKFLVCDTPTVADFHAVFAFEWMHKKYSADATISGQNSKKQKVHMYAYVRTVDSIQ
mmetsp:Transcript_25037/g.44520  ORF Transcript_25037/g.44520 Transcript_25037/m.44520 type:complete len:187 (+) Transcript_25037:41-601(+)